MAPCAFVQLLHPVERAGSYVQCSMGIFGELVGDPWLWFRNLKASPSWSAWAKAFLLLTGKDDVRAICIETDKVG